MDITTILTAVITLIAALLSTFLVPWLRSKTGEGKWAQLSGVVRMVVNAAEQMNAAGLLTMPKLDYALGCVRTALSNQGLQYDEQVIRAMIEAAVRDMNSKAGA